jgi:fructose-1,6-bisphosphatase/inositol monophosphatase family enzyme
MELLKLPLGEERKADGSLVTKADLASNDILLSGLRAVFPGHGIISEETGPDGPPDSPFVWFLDPLDGTRAYARGKPGFCVMLGLVRCGRPVLGVVYDPLADDLYEASSGGGAFYEHGGARRPARVSLRSSLGEMPVVTSTGFPEPYRKLLRPALGGPWLTPINSVGVKAGLVTRGEADIYVSHHAVHYWDTAGPLAILEEAGGRMTLWTGGPLVFGGGAPYAHAGLVLATNGSRHDDVVRTLEGLKSALL